MILAIDTSLGSAVAVVDPSGNVRGEAVSENPRGHAEVIGGLIESALADADTTAAQITAVAVGMGPGPFTGLRVGIAAARTFAIGRGVPVIPLVSHDAAALALAIEHRPFVVSTDARRRERAVSMYDGRDAHGRPQRVDGPRLVPVGGAVGADAESSSIRGSSIRDSGILDDPNELIIEVDAIPAGALGALAAIALEDGVFDGPAEPLYLRAPDVTPPGPRKQVGT